MSEFEENERPQLLSESLRGVWQGLVSELLVKLDAKMDCRLVSTFALTLRGLLVHRHRNNGLLLSELGAYLLSPDKAPAGTKRLSNLLRCPRWSAEDVFQHLWQHAQEQVQTWSEGGQQVLVLWDSSVLEKPESQKAQGLCAVRSSKAVRLSRIKPGFYRPPGAPVFVPGWHWMALLFIATSGPPCVGAMRWWGTRSQVSSTSDLILKHLTLNQSSSSPVDEAFDEPELEPWLAQAGRIRSQLLQECKEAMKSIGVRVLHIFDRGFAGAAWLRELSEQQEGFVMRWPKVYKLRDTHGVERKAWQHLRGQRSWAACLVPDARRGQLKKLGVVAVPVFHGAYGEGQVPLWLIAARSGGGREPWYLLTSERVEDAETALALVRAYARRWHIEMAFRFNKSELALESPRLWSWERRLKMLAMVTLLYALLLSLLRLPRQWLEQLLRFGCHRTGKRSRNTPTPLYRLRLALANLLSALAPPFLCYQSSG